MYTTVELKMGYDKDKQREYYKEWYKKNKDREKIRKQIWYECNREAIAQRRKERRYEDKSNTESRE